MWRFAEMLPVQHTENIVSLGEGMTPIVPLTPLENHYALRAVFMKDESVNPTGSFKARGISVAVSRMLELGINNCIIPTAGNAGYALAVYCAKAGINCVVVMPRHTPASILEQCRETGAQLVLVEGLISDCATEAAHINQDGSYFDVSTLKEPYRLEGKKTMGYEIAEQLGWELPEVIVYPTGGGTGLIGIWKAFREMQELGWISGSLPRMIAVQTANCAPLVEAQKNPAGWKQSLQAIPSLATGLVVPYPFGLQMMQQVLRESGGEVVVVSEREIQEGMDELASLESVSISPEGSAAWMGLRRLRGEGKIGEDERVLFLNTGKGY